MLDNQCQPSQRDLPHTYENWKYSYDFPNSGHSTASESLCLKSKSPVINLYLSGKLFLNIIAQEKRMLKL